jgi:hypothetical protein
MVPFPFLLAVLPGNISLLTPGFGRIELRRKSPEGKVTERRLVNFNAAA